MVSIVIPNYFVLGGPKSKYCADEILTVLYRPCIRRIKEYTKQDECELILIDNGSDFGSEEIEKDADICIKNEENLGFGKACNQGFRRASGDWIVCMNNDVFVYEGWIDALKQTFDMNKNCGFAMPALVVGFKDAYEADKIKDIKPHLQSNRDRYGRTSFGSLWMTKRELLFQLMKKEIELGERKEGDDSVFDENFKVGFREDKDLFLRMEKHLGLIPLKTHNTRVFHQGNTTIAKVDSWRDATKANREYFYKKWNCNEDDVKLGTILKKEKKVEEKKEESQIIEKIEKVAKNIESAELIKIGDVEDNKPATEDIEKGREEVEKKEVGILAEEPREITLKGSDGKPKTVKEKKIAILTTFAGYDPGYALHVGTLSRAKMMAEYGLNFDVLVQTNYNCDFDFPNMKKVVPHLRLCKWEHDAERAKENGEILKKELPKILEPYDVIITHDLIYQRAYVCHNIAIHDMAPKFPNKKWFHWIHSGPKFPRVTDAYPGRLFHTLPVNSKIVYMNDTDALRIAESYGTTLDNVRVVYNTKDVRDFFNFGEVACKLIQDNDLLSADVMQIFPFSTPRHEGKQIKKVIRLFSNLKKHGQKVKLVLATAHAGRNMNIIEELRKYGEELNLTKEDLIITAEQGYSHGIPRDAISNLFQISDLFVFPSTSEVCPNVLLEASLAGNLLVINESLPCLKEFCSPKALGNWGFSSIHFNTDFPNKKAEAKWYNEVAMIIIGELLKERTYHIRKFAFRHYNFKYIFEKQFLPMISEL